MHPTKVLAFLVLLLSLSRQNSITDEFDYYSVDILPNNNNFALHFKNKTPAVHLCQLMQKNFMTASLYEPSSIGFFSSIRWFDSKGDQSRRSSYRAELYQMLQTVTDKMDGLYKYYADDEYDPTDGMKEKIPYFKAIEKFLKTRKDEKYLFNKEKINGLLTELINNKKMYLYMYERNVQFKNIFASTTELDKKINELKENMQDCYKKFQEYKLKSKLGLSSIHRILKNKKNRLFLKVYYEEINNWGTIKNYIELIDAHPNVYDHLEKNVFPINTPQEIKESMKELKYRSQTLNSLNALSEYLKVAGPYMKKEFELKSLEYNMIDQYLNYHKNTHFKKQSTMKRLKKQISKVTSKRSNLNSENKSISKKEKMQKIKELQDENRKYLKTFKYFEMIVNRKTLKIKKFDQIGITKNKIDNIQKILDKNIEDYKSWIQTLKKNLKEKVSEILTNCKSDLKSLELYKIYKTELKELKTNIKSLRRRVEKCKDREMLLDKLMEQKARVKKYRNLKTSKNKDTLGESETLVKNAIKKRKEKIQAQKMYFEDTRKKAAWLFNYKFQSKDKKIEKEMKKLEKEKVFIQEMLADMRETISESFVIPHDMAGVLMRRFSQVFNMDRNIDKYTKKTFKKKIQGIISEYKPEEFKKLKIYQMNYLLYTLRQLALVSNIQKLEAKVDRELAKVFAFLHNHMGIYKCLSKKDLAFLFFNMIKTNHIVSEKDFLNTYLKLIPPKDQIEFILYNYTLMPRNKYIRGITRGYNFREVGIQKMLVTRRLRKQFVENMSLAINLVKDYSDFRVSSEDDKKKKFKATRALKRTGTRIKKLVIYLFKNKYHHDGTRIAIFLLLGLIPFFGANFIAAALLSELLSWLIFNL